MVQPSRIYSHSKAFQTSSAAKSLSTAQGQYDLVPGRLNTRRVPALVGILWIMILPIAVACLVACGGFTAPKSSATTLQITTNVLPVGTVQDSYSAPLVAAGGVPPYLWAQAGGQLPAGLTLNPATGAIVGVPTSSGTFSFIAKVHDSTARFVSSGLSLEVSTTPSTETPLRIVTTALPVGAQQNSYGATLVASGGVPPYSWEQTGGRLPAGIALASSTGTIAGTPISAGNFSFTTRVQDSKANSASTGFSLNVSTAPVPAVSGVSPSSGPNDGGTFVTIGGNNFASGAVVEFGGVASQSVRVVSPTEIQAVTPVGPSGMVSVTVQNSDGQVATAANAFKFAAPATPTGSSSTTINADVMVDASQTVSDTGGDDLAAAKNTYSSASAPESDGGLYPDWNVISSEFAMKRMRNINGLADCALDGSGHLTGCSRLNNDLQNMKNENLTPHVVVGQVAPASIGGNPLRWGTPQWAQYDALCYAIVNYVANQYGGTGFSEALFEVENEIDITTDPLELWLTPTSSVPQGAPSRFTQYDTVYRHWAAAVDRVAKQNLKKKIRIAAEAEGYEWVSYSQPWHNEMIQKYDAEGVRFDVIALHAYGGDITNIAQYAQSVRAALTANGNSHTEIWITEFGASGSGDSYFGAINSSNQGASWAIAFLLQAFKATVTGGSFLIVRDNQGHDTAGVAANMYEASWDHDHNGVEYPKAIANAFSMIDRMAGTRKSAVVSTAKPDLQALASSDTSSASLIVANYNYVFNYKDKNFSDLTKPETVTVAFKNLPISGAVTVDRYVIDATTSNLNEWMAAGKTPPSLQSTQLQKVESFSANSTGGTVTLPSRELGQSAVSLWVVHQ